MCALERAVDLVPEDRGAHGGSRDAERGGSLTVTPVDLRESAQRYLEDTGVLVTELVSPLRDYGLALSAGVTLYVAASNLVPSDLPAPPESVRQSTM